MHGGLWQLHAPSTILGNYGLILSYHSSISMIVQWKDRLWQQIRCTENSTETASYVLLPISMPHRSVGRYSWSRLDLPRIVVKGLKLSSLCCRLDQSRMGMLILACAQVHEKHWPEVRTEMCGHFPRARSFRSQAWSKTFTYSSQCWIHREKR